MFQNTKLEAQKKFKEHGTKTTSDFSYEPPKSIRSCLAKSEGTLKYVHGERRLKNVTNIRMGENWFNKSKTKPRSTQQYQL